MKNPGRYDNSPLKDPWIPSETKNRSKLEHTTQPSFIPKKFFTEVPQHRKHASKHNTPLHSDPPDHPLFPPFSLDTQCHPLLARLRTHLP